MDILDRKYIVEWDQIFTQLVLSGVRLYTATIADAVKELARDQGLIFTMDMKQAFIGSGVPVPYYSASISDYIEFKNVPMWKRTGDLEYLCVFKSPNLFLEMGCIVGHQTLMIVYTHIKAILYKPKGYSINFTRKSLNHYYTTIGVPYLASQTQKTIKKLKGKTVVFAGRPDPKHHITQKDMMDRLQAFGIKTKADVFGADFVIYDPYAVEHMKVKRARQLGIPLISYDKVQTGLLPTKELLDILEQHYSRIGPRIEKSSQTILSRYKVISG